MKKTILSLILFASLGLSAQIGTQAQITSSKWTFGGYAGVTGSFGSNAGYAIHLTPKVGYKVMDNLEAGFSASFSWQNSSIVSSTIVGLGPYINYYFERNFFVSTLFQEYIVTEKLKSNGNRIGYREEALYLGGGYMQRLGSNSYMQIGGMYNVLWKQNNSVFSSGFVPNIGVVFGL